MLYVNEMSICKNLPKSNIASGWLKGMGTIEEVLNVVDECNGIRTHNHIVVNDHSTI